MYTRLLSWLSRIFLIMSLLAGLSITTGAVAAPSTLPVALAKTGFDAQALDVSTTGATFPPITIPATKSAPTIDGVCTKNEYGSASGYSFADQGGFSATVNLMHDNNYLYVCMVGTAGTYKARFASLYLDPQGNGISYQYAQQDDYSLRLNIPGTMMTSLRGSGVINGYVDAPEIASNWDGAATADAKYDMAEYRVNLKAFGLNPCGSLFGMAVYHHWVTGVGDDYGWPSNQWFDQPRTWQLVTLGGAACGSSGKIAYVFKGNTLDATSFYNLLTGAGYSVTLVPLGSVLTTDFSAFDLIMIADDTGLLDQWGTSGSTAAQVAQITSPAKPVMGLGEGGYAFFGQLSLYIGWPRGWHGPQGNIRQAATAPPAIFNGIATADPIPDYTVPDNSVGIFLKSPTPPADVVPYGMEDPLDDHASLIQEGCQLLWGNSGNPLGMTSDGQSIFLNSVAYIRDDQCPPPVTTPPVTCYTLQKTASPDPTAAVTPGQVITYTLTYQLKTVAGANCPTEAKLVDVVPVGTTFVPGSASDGISPGSDGALTWLVTPSASTLTKKFSVVVSDNVCSANRVVANFGELRFSGASPLDSNTVTHTVTCPPVGLPSNQPIFAETELKVNPYPLVAGTETEVEVTVQNLTSAELWVTVQFQLNTSSKFGIGLAYTTFATSRARLPANMTIGIANWFTPTFSGNACIQAVVSTPGMSAPLLTQSCLDVTEHLSPGTPATLVVPVRNNTAAAADIMLVVDNACPGWTATVTNPSSGVISNLASHATQNATLSITPPATGLLGSGCHIDLQAWIGTTMIGGVRKLDVAPVHLPLDVQPSYEEAEIWPQPYPPTAGVPAQLCIQLVNPLAKTSVTVDFAVADFGAGIPFTPAVSGTFNLPAHSIGIYCVAWTPAVGGTLHRCILATLRQAGYLDQHSQHNIDLVHLTSPTSLVGQSLAFVVGNPDLIDHTLSFMITVVGADEGYMPTIQPGGGTLSATLPAGGQATYQLSFPNTPVVTFGSETKIQVTYLLDGTPVGGFTIMIARQMVFMPLLKR